MRYNFDMVEIPSSLSDSAALDPTLTTSANPKRQCWFELGLVLLIAFLTPIFNSLYFLQRGTAMQLGQGNSRWIFGLIHETTYLLLLGYVLSRRAVFPRPRTSLLPATFLLGAAPGLRRIHFHLGRRALTPNTSCAHLRLLSNGPQRTDFFAHLGLMSIPFMFLNPLFGELIVRTYLYL